MDDLRLVVAEKAPTIAIAVAVLLVATVILPRLHAGKNQALAKLPFFGLEWGNAVKREKRFLTNAQDIYRDGYRKFRDTIYRHTTVDGEFVVVPPKYLPELRKRPDADISIERAFNVTLEAKHSGLKFDMPLVTHVVRADLTPGLTRINPALSKAVDKVLRTELPPCEDWTLLNINNKLLRIVAIVSGHIFIGPDLCWNEDYIRTSIEYTVDVMGSVRSLKTWRKAFRSFGAYFSPELKRVRQHRSSAAKILSPIIHERREAMKRGEEMPDDMLQWMLNKAEAWGETSDERMALCQLGLSMAAIHTTTMTATQAFYDLVAYPELMEELRHEIRTVLKEHNGVFTTNALYHMKLFDSFLKESMRINPLGYVRFQRMVGRPITLSDGTHLPENTIIEVAHEAMTQDPTLYPNPETFDPYRSYKLRQTASGENSNASRNQAVTVSDTNLHFGYGRHACPGRFFAVNEIKLIVANMLLQFDMKMPDGETKRYPNISIGVNQIPDPTKKLLFKRISSE